ncbi:hypothetical protein OAK76_00100 [Akkermansiaceae bacterium]|nr:hypothetical protein [Akkermansiaceae bacterium]
MPDFSKIPKIILLIWLSLVISIGASLYNGLWSTVFVSMVALVMTALPIIFAERFEVKLPIRFAAAISIFAFATLFLGEVRDYYSRFWWWDVVLHTASAVGFGLIGFLGVFMLFEGDRFKAPPIALTILSFCFAVSIGAIWEIFEFAMDQIFGMNMQKSGLIDTMWDLIVDCIGAIIGSSAGFLYLEKRHGTGLLAGWIRSFIRLNKKLYSKSEEKS